MITLAEMFGFLEKKVIVKTITGKEFRGICYPYHDDPDDEGYVEIGQIDIQQSEIISITEIKEL